MEILPPVPIRSCRFQDSSCCRHYRRYPVSGRRKPEAFLYDPRWLPELSESGEWNRCRHAELPLLRRLPLHVSPCGAGYRPKLLCNRNILYIYIAALYFPTLGVVMFPDELSQKSIFSNPFRKFSYGLMNHIAYLSPWLWKLAGGPDSQPGSGKRSASRCCAQPCAGGRMVRHREYPWHNMW